METSMEVVHDFPTGGHSFHRGLPKIQDPVICTSLNIASYVDRYDGFTKLQRLIFIAEKCSNLQEEAYRQLLTELKRGSNSVLYMKIYVLVGEILGYGSDADKDWIDSVEKREAIKLERLESELMAAKTTMVKESIRLSYNDIGDLHYERGNLSEAMKTYLRTRDYCTLPKHNSQMCVRVISASMDLGQYGNVMFYVKKADFALTEPIIGSQLKAANALALLIEGQYKEAARKFLEVGIDLGGTFSSVIAAEDVAMYGTLCALASLDRPEIRKSIMENSAFKSFFELAPDVRSLVDNFFAGKYGACLVYLENVKPELLLDIHLSKHVTPLIAQITERIILQYFSPYSSVDMNRMASSLNMTLVKLEKEVASLISSEKISARLAERTVIGLMIMIKLGKASGIGLR
jgi:COP9 signalosome complex subunit 1